MGQVIFENEQLSMAIQANKRSFKLTEQADLDLPAITSSSVINIDDEFYLPTMATPTHKNNSFCVLYDDGDIEWLPLAEANKAVRFHTQTGLLQEVNNIED